MLRTTDAGRSWGRIRLPKSLRVDFLSAVEFADADHGWAVGAASTGAGVVIATVDGGKSWRRQNAQNASWLESVDFVDASHGCIGGVSGTVLVTTDGGDHWRAQDSPAKDSVVSMTMGSVAFVDGERGWAVGRDDSMGLGTILLTTDGGMTWSGRGPEDAEYFEGVPQAVCFADSTHGWVFGCSSQIVPGSLTPLKTTDGGVTWDTMPEVRMASAMDAVFGDASHGWCVGSSGDRPNERLLLTTDGGGSWRWTGVRGVGAGSVGYLRGIDALDNDTLVAVGDDASGKGIIISSGDGGRTWDLRPVGDCPALQDVTLAR